MDEGIRLQALLRWPSFYARPGGGKSLLGLAEAVRGEVARVEASRAPARRGPRPLFPSPLFEAVLCSRGV
jgi:hypothetical protein